MTGGSAGQGGASDCRGLEILDMAEEQAGSDDTSAAQTTRLDSGSTTCRYAYAYIYLLLLLFEYYINEDWMFY